MAEAEAIGNTAGERATTQKIGPTTKEAIREIGNGTLKLANILLNWLKEMKTNVPKRSEAEKIAQEVSKFHIVQILGIRTALLDQLQQLPSNLILKITYLSLRGMRLKLVVSMRKHTPW